MLESNCKTWASTNDVVRSRTYPASCTSSLQAPSLQCRVLHRDSDRWALGSRDASLAPMKRVHLEPPLPSPSSRTKIMPVKFHSYEEASCVPGRVRELVELMKKPLLGTQRLASLPSMTPLALAQLQRIPADTSASDDLPDKISNVANLVLSTSKAIEESVCEARPTISHWYTLLRTIARNCHPDARVMYASFHLDVDLILTYM